VTIAAVAQALGRKVVADERTLSLLRARYGDALKPALRRLAEIPEGATLTWGPGPGSSYPVLSLENVIILPGVPSLLREGFARLRERFRAPPIFSRALFLSLGEGAIAEHLDATVARFPAVAIGSYPRFDDADHRVKVTFDGRDQAEVTGAAEFFAARVPQGTVLREG
jgi:molybdopterin-biosynthesis enzyme MoeA-like protein